jgi:tetratricopeptide (TPR) repeat protein
MRKCTHSILTLVAVTLSIVVGVSCSPRSQTARYLARADQYFELGQYDKAEIEYINVLHADPSNLRALSRLGSLYFEQGRLGRAIPCLLKARELDPKNLDLRVKLGFVYLAGGRFREARDEAYFVLAGRPQDGEAPLLLAEAAVAPQDIEEARQRLQKLPSPTTATAPQQVALATLYFRQRDFKAAEAALKRGQALDSKSSAVYSAFGTLYWAQNDLKQAEQAFQTAAELSPPRSPRRLRYAQFKIQNGDVAAGKRILEEFVQKTPDYLPAWMSLAEVAANEKKYDECMALINKMLVRDPMNYDALLLGGRVKLAHGETAKAATEFEGMAKVYPQSPVVHYDLALACLAENELGKALGNLNKTLALDPNFADATLLLAELKIRSGDRAAAIVSLKQLIQQRPDIASAQLLLADTYRAQGSLDDSLSVYRQSEKLFPQNPRIRFMSGLVLLQQNRLDEARQAFGTTLELAPYYLPALDRLVDLDLKENQYQQALQRVQKQLEKNPTQPEPLLLLAKVYLAQGDTNQTEAALMKAIKLQPDFHPPYLLLARLYVASGQHQKALQNLQAVVAKDPKAIGALMLIGMIHDQQKNYDAARETYERILVVDPKFSPALNNLAYLYSERFGLLDKAYEVARRARELLPSDPATADTLGWILYKKSQYPWALSLLQESADKLPDQPEVQFHLGMACYMMGEEEPARLALQRALSLTKEFLGGDEASRCLSILAYDVKTAGTEARAGLEKQVAERPDDPIALTRLAAIYERAGTVDKAIQAYQKALKANPKNVRALIDLAQLYSAHLQDTQQAIELAKTAYKLAPDDPSVSHTLGRLAYQTGDYQWAANLLRETARKQSKEPEVLYDLALATYSVGQVVDAEDAMRSALRSGVSFSHVAEANRFLDLTALSAKPSQALIAQSRIEQVLKLDPRYVPALMVMAAISEQKSTVTDAEQIYERVLSRYPDFTPAKKRLAILYAEDPAKNQRAYDLATKAREVYPADPEIAKTLGILVYRQGDYARSVNLLKEGASKRDGDAELLYYLGMAQYRLKERGESKHALQRALDLKLSDNLAGEAKRVLAELK